MFWCLGAFVVVAYGAIDHPEFAVRSEDLGAEEIIYLNIQDRSLTMVNPSSQNEHCDVGDQISICMNTASIFVFEEDTGSRIGRGVDNFNA